MKRLVTLLLLIGITGCGSQDPATVAFKKGAELGKSKDWDAAIASYTEAIRLKPHVAVGYYHLGIAYSNTGEYEKAIANLTEAIRRDPTVASCNNPHTAYRKRAGLSRSADWVDVLKNRGRIDPIYAVAYCKRGVTRKQFGEKCHTQAIGDFTEARAKNYRIGRQSSSRDLRPLVTNTAATAKARGLGLPDMKRKGLHEAIRADVMQLGKNNRSAVQQYFADLARADKAIADFTEAIRINPGNAEAYLSRGHRYKVFGLYGKGIADFTEAIRINPGNAEAYLSRAVTYRYLGDETKADADFAKAIRINPGDAETYLNRGKLYHQLGFPSVNDSDKASDDITAAIADFTEAIRINPDYAEAYHARGRTRKQFGEKCHTQAIGDFTEAIRINPDYAEAYVNRGVLLLERNQVNSNQNTIDRLNNVGLGGELLVAEDIADKHLAIADFTEAIRIKSDYAEAYYNRGVAYGKKPAGQNPFGGKKGDKAKAEADFAKAKELGYEPKQ